MQSESSPLHHPHSDDQIADRVHRLSAPLSIEHRGRLVEALATWNFKPHRLDDGDLYRVATLLFEAVLDSEGISELGIQRGTSLLSPVVT